MTIRTAGRRALTASIALAAGLLSAEARATTTCSITEITGVSFGSYNVFDPSPVDVTGQISFVCSGVGAGDSISIALSAGGATSPFSRRMTRSSSNLLYNLFLDAARLVVWGDGAGGSTLYGPVTPASGVTETVTIYGRIPAQQNVSVGMYADTVIATILF